MSTQASITKTERFVFRIDKALIEELDRVARSKFEGNRSLATREALRDLIEKYERDAKKEVA